jgi:hypothetical protein
VQRGVAGRARDDEVEVTARRTRGDPVRRIADTLPDAAGDPRRV